MTSKPEAREGRILLGTQSFSYDAWDGLVYPVGLARTKRIGYYARLFPVMELDNTYYAVPNPKLLAACALESGLIGTIHVPELRVEAPVLLDRARATLGDAAYDAAQARGRRMTLQEAVEFALTEPATPPASQHPAPGGLSPRESQVAARVARGLTNREIAADLVITEHTAMRHVEHILT